MAEITLKADTGRTLGTRPSKRLRAEGKVPAVVYGLGSEPVPVTVDWQPLREALTTDAGLNALIDLDVDGDSAALHRQGAAAAPDPPDRPARRLPARSAATRRSPSTCRSSSRARPRRSSTRTAWSTTCCSPLTRQRQAGRHPQRAHRRHLGARDRRHDPRGRPRAAERRHHRRRPRGGRRHRPSPAPPSRRSRPRASEGEEGAEGEEGESEGAGDGESGGDEG